MVPEVISVKKLSRLFRGGFQIIQDQSRLNHCLGGTYAMSPLRLMEDSECGRIELFDP